MTVDREALTRFLVTARDLAGGKTKVAWDVVVDAYKREFPHVFHDAGQDMKAGVMALLDALVATGSIELPRGKEHWDATAQPRIPAWIKVVPAAPDPATPRPWKAHAWHPLLEQFTSPAKVSDETYEAMLAINEFMKQGAIDRPRIPVKERSLQVLGDEKRLEEIMKASWGSCVTHELMRTYKTREPITFVKLARAGGLAPIIVENRDTFHSLWRRCKDMGPRSPFSHVLYGKGKQIIDSIPNIKDVDPGIDTIEYFGDIDAYGLQIPVDAQARLDAEDVTVRIVAAEGLYARMMDLHDATGIETGTKEGNRECSVAGLAFLGERLAGRAAAVMARGKRIPQEIVNYEDLCMMFI